MSCLYIEEFGIAKVVKHLFGPEVYFEQCSITMVVIYLLVSGDDIEQFGITKVVYRTVRYN